jgi:hypothetical protein
LLNFNQRCVCRFNRQWLLQLCSHPPVLVAESTHYCIGGAPWYCANHVATVRLTQSSIAHNGVGAVSNRANLMRTVGVAEASLDGGDRTSAWKDAHNWSRDPTMLVAATSYLGGGGAAWLPAQCDCLFLTAVLAAESPCFCVGGAAWHSATASRPVFVADPFPIHSVREAFCCRASAVRTVLHAQSQPLGSTCTPFGRASPPHPGLNHHHLTSSTANGTWHASKERGAVCVYCLCTRR